MVAKDNKGSNEAKLPGILEGLTDLVDYVVNSIADKVVDALVSRLEQNDVVRHIERNRLVNLNGAADYLNMPKSTIYKRSSTGKLPSVKIGKSVLFALSDLADYVESHRRGPDVVLKLAREVRRKAEE